ncbi:MAG: glycosyl hydrolase, partial [Eudoraea sp.]
GGPPPAPVLSKEEGLNRFVWDMLYPIIPGIPDVYIEANFRGHKAPPGTYTIRLQQGDKTVNTTAKILETPGFETQQGQYAVYDAFMTELEQNVTQMHQMINTLFSAKTQLIDIINDLEDTTLKKAGMTLFNKLNAWDEEMIQRKSQAYDDVENFPNKFTAEYLFLIDETNSKIPRVNTSSRTRKNELDKEWSLLKMRGNEFLDKELPDFNKKLWEAGIGAIRYNK